MRRGLGFANVQRMSEDVVSVSGRVVSGDAEGTTISVALRVGDEILEQRGVAGQLDLILDDKGMLTVEFDAATRATKLHEVTREGAWERLAKDPVAKLVSGRAPGPHVRATLIRRVARLGERVLVRGRVVGRSGAVVTRIAAAELTLASKLTPSPIQSKAARSKVDVGDLVARAVGVILLLVTLYAALRWVVLWPEQLEHRGITYTRLAVGVACSLHAGIWLALVIRRRGGGVMRMLPRFVAADGEVISAEMLGVALGTGVVASAMFGAIGGLVMLDEIAKTGNVMTAGNKGPLVDGAVVPTVGALLMATLGWFAMWGLEGREARLAALFRDRGSSWTARAGHLRAGSLSLYMRISGTNRSASRHWSAEISGPLELELDGRRVTLAPKGLVWGIDPVTSVESSQGRVNEWSMGPDSTVAVAGRLRDSDSTMLQATGPESLVLVASADPDVLAGLRRGLWKRRLVLAVPLLGVLATAALLLSH